MHAIPKSEGMGECRCHRRGHFISRGFVLGGVNFSFGGGICRIRRGAKIYAEREYFSRGRICTRRRVGFMLRG